MFKPVKYMDKEKIIKYKQFMCPVTKCIFKAMLIEFSNGECGWLVPLTAQVESLPSEWIEVAEA